MDDIERQLLCKTNMTVVDKLLNIIEDWQEVISPRHVKFVQSYFKYNKDLALVGKEFNFNETDMLFIFWRIQTTLQEEYCRRVILGEVNRTIYIYKVKEISRKKKIIRSELKSNICEFKKKSK